MKKSIFLFLLILSIILPGGTPARAEYSYEKFFIESRHGNYIKKISGNSVQTVYRGYTGANLNEYNTVIDAYEFDFDGNFVSIKPTPKPVGEPTAAPVEFNEYNMAIVSKEVDGIKKYGVINDKYEIVIDYEYDHINSEFYQNNNDIILGAKKGEKYAVINSTGKALTDFIYDDVVFNNFRGNIRVFRNNHAGYLKKDYTECMDLTVYSCDIPYMSEYIITKSELGYALADMDGNIITDFYSELIYYSGGLCEAKYQSGRYGAINYKGETVIPPKYSQISFKKTMVICHNPNEFIDIYDYNGKLLFSLDADYVVYNDDYLFVSKNNKEAIFDLDGNQLTDFIYDWLGYFDFWALGTIYRIDGTPVIIAEVNDEQFYIDENFTKIDIDNETEKYYSSPSFDQNAKLFVSTVNDKQALLNRETKEFIIPYSEGLKINYTVAETYTYHNEVRSGLIDSNGNVVIEFPFAADKIIMIDDGFYCVEIGERWLVYDWMGNNVLGDGYRDVAKLDYGMYFVTDDDGVWLMKSDVIDTAYVSSVKTYINGAEIPCYAVDGYVCVLAEDLGGYGFDVVWNGDEQRLDVIRNPEYYQIIPAEITGTYNTDIFKSRIKTYFNNAEIPSYQIDGKTLIRIESMESEEISSHYDPQSKRLDITVSGLETK